jgi:hypothetical protein
MENRYRLGSYALSIVLILLFISSVVRADVTGSIQGVVRDRTQGAIAGVTLPSRTRKPISNKKPSRPLMAPTASWLSRREPTSSTPRRRDFSSSIRPTSK